VSLFRKFPGETFDANQPLSVSSLTQKANVSDAFEEEATAAGGDGFISKPFNLGVIEKAFGSLRF